MEKSKKNKILKGLGIGALACLGVFTFAGCSIELSQDQIDKVMYTVDNADTFMDETLDLLNKQNAELDQEEAWDLYKLAQAKFKLNVDGIRDNVKMTSRFGIIYLYDTASDGYVMISAYDEEYGVQFADNYNIYSFSSIDGNHSKKLLDIDNSGQGCEAYISWNNFSHSTMYGVQEEDIVSCQKLDNGNYKITFLSETLIDEEENNSVSTVLLVVEVSADARIISETSQYAMIGDYHNNGGISYFDSPVTVVYEYGVVTEADIAEYLAEAKAAELTE